jgi:hypothetical protein
VAPESEKCRLLVRYAGAVDVVVVEMKSARWLSVMAFAKWM